MLTDRFVRQQFYIRINHDADELMESDFRFPIKNFLRFGSVANQEIDFGRTLIPWVVLHVSFPIKTGMRKSCLDNLPNAVRFAGGQYKVVSFIMLKNPPHAFDVLSAYPQSRFASRFPRNNSCCKPCLIAATAREILRVTKVSLQRGLS